MPLNAYIEAGDNPDLTEERRRCTFDTEEVAAWLWGGEQVTAPPLSTSFQLLKRRRGIRNAVYAIPEFAEPKPRAFLTRKELIEFSQQKVAFKIEHSSGICPQRLH